MNVSNYLWWEYHNVYFILSCQSLIVLQNLRRWIESKATAWWETDHYKRIKSMLFMEFCLLTANDCTSRALWRRKWQPTPVFLPREFHGQRNWAGYSPWDCTVGYVYATNFHFSQLRVLTWKHLALWFINIEEGCSHLIKLTAFCLWHVHLSK